MNLQTKSTTLSKANQNSKFRKNKSFNKLPNYYNIE